ncbi:polysaccharide biosynthesis protein [Nitratiruptor tergarcus]|uniref:UDP-N-acetyl-D-glucosamine 4,6-dehydratase n=1 Tax=Nitratiruptor tergarcus DSM 16512 TaxID=1069081 RepID=A0A1W1WRZ0_9BACT|nr:nucleoside-diphosphate sugar epimerase/dehydratase [Nitratiruptor tergarcus]SMC08975.1 UDP-N-acetyl-D-glucosamine 4,6-dehydratase [Nitratiruptor tergarcus DSM 16512]
MRKNHNSLLKPTTAKRVLFFIIADAIFSLLSLLLAYTLRYSFSIPPIAWHDFWKIYLVITFIKIVFLYLFKQYHFTWRYYGLSEARKLLLALIGAYSVAIFLLFPLHEKVLLFPRSALFIDFFLSLVFLAAVRIAKRVWIESTKHKSIKTCAIYGISPNTKNLIDAFFSGELDYKPLAIIDNNRSGNFLSSIPILSEEKFWQHLTPDALIIATKLEPKKLQDLEKKAKEHGIDEIKIATLTKEPLRNLEIEDLLARKPRDLDSKAIGEFIKNKRVLITGAGGSIGSELVQQCFAYGAKEVIGVEISEYNLYVISEKHPSLIPYLCDVTQYNEIASIIQKYKPDIILHAAAYKHVPLAELNPQATVKNNILGTKNCIDAAIAHEVPHFVLISTDKAVNPTNIMGATKRVCELYAQSVPSHNTTICAVRFGNVLGSSGSVIPKFKAQIEQGGPITVTHPEITRYFMLTSEACQLVLQAATIAKGKEIFILDMGEPVKIVDLAKKMMEIYNKEVPIKFIGLRPGEKLYEEILLEGAEEPTRYESIYIAKPDPIDFAKLKEKIEKLLQTQDPQKIITLLQELVPEFHHTPHR